MTQYNRQIAKELSKILMAATLSSFAIILIIKSSYSPMIPEKLERNVEYFFKNYHGVCEDDGIIIGKEEKIEIAKYWAYEKYPDFGIFGSAESPDFIRNNAIQYSNFNSFSKDQLECCIFEDWMNVSELSPQSEYSNIQKIKYRMMGIRSGFVLLKINIKYNGRDGQIASASANPQGVYITNCGEILFGDLAYP